MDSFLRASPESLGAGTLRRKFKRLENFPVTICVVALSSNRWIIGASDRMLTAGDIEFEPEEPKHRKMSNSIVMMFSGDASFHCEIAGMVERDVNALIAQDPDHWVEVRHVVDLYVQHRNTLKVKAAEAAILAPLGLSQNLFLQTQAGMQPDLVRQIAQDLVQYPVPPVSCIIAGVDGHGGHIYTVENGNVTYHNATGFAAIGIGHWHAESELMGRHRAHASIPETVCLVHRAKKRAETAPGVGSKTDLYMIAGRGGYSGFRDGIAEKLDELYENLARQEAEAKEKIHGELAAYVDSFKSAEDPEQESAAVDEDKPEPPGRSQPTALN